MYMHSIGRYNYWVNVVEEDVEYRTGSQGGRLTVELSQTRENWRPHFWLQLQRGREREREGGSSVLMRFHECVCVCVVYVCVCVLCMCVCECTTH